MKARDERPLAAVPRALVAAIALALAAQLCWSGRQPPPRAAARDLPPAPPLVAMRLAAAGEPVALGKLAMLWLQAFDLRADSKVPYRELDYDRLIAWLERIVALDPHADYALQSAARLYAEVPDQARQRKMLDFVYRRFLDAPDERWAAMAHATLVAKHRLKDLALARKYAVALQERTLTDKAPLWVRQMEGFILEDMNELEAARIVIGGLLQSGQVKDARDAQLLEARLKALEARIAAERVGGESNK